MRPTLRALALSSSLVIACSGGEPEASPPASSMPEVDHAPPETSGTPGVPPTEPPAIEDDDPLADLAEPVREDEVIEARPTPLRTVTLAIGECQEVAEAPVRVLSRASAASIVGVGERFYLAAYEPLDAGAEQVSVVELVAGGAPRLVVSVPVTAPLPSDRRSAAPALARAPPPCWSAR